MKKMPFTNRPYWLALACLLLSGCMKLEPAPIMVELNERLEALPPPAQPYHDGIVYKEAWFSDVKLDLYLPYNYSPESSQRHPVYLHVHGGSWLFGNRKFIRLGDAMIETLRQAGIAVISIDYRKLNEVGFQRVVDDAQSSLRWLAENAASYNLDPTRTVLHGPSAGGHLVLMMAFANEDPRIGFELLIDEYGPSDLLALKNRESADGGNLLGMFPEFRLKPISPIEYVKPGLPPVYIIHGEFDELVPLSQSESLVSALRAVGVPVELEIVKGANHGLLNADAGVKQRLQDIKVEKILAALRPLKTES